MKRSGPPGRCTQTELRELAQGVRTLTQGLGARRNLAGTPYLDDRHLLGAYLLYFWPVSYAQAAWCLRQAGFSAARPPRRALDLGCGPGPATAALSDCSAQAILSVDQSGPALAALRSLFHPPTEPATLRHNLEHGLPHLAPPPFDCIILGHVLNELWSDQPDAPQRRINLVQDLTKRLHPQGTVIVFEPATHSISRNLLALRDGLAASGSAIDAPCTTPQPCPALPDPSGMCYVSVPWVPPPILRDIARVAGPHREALKMSYLLVRPSPTTPSADEPTYRVVSDPLLNKAGRTRVLICGPRGRFSLSIAPHDTSPAARLVASLHRGQALVIQAPEPRGEGWAVGKETHIRRV
jgi:hypothetical protein